MAFLGQMDTAVESIGTRTEVPILGLSMRDENRFEIRYRSRLVVDKIFGMTGTCSPWDGSAMAIPT